MPKTISAIGASNDKVTRESTDDGTFFQIRLHEDNVPLSGFGPSARAAAEHLAQRLRSMAAMIERIEGSPDRSTEITRPAKRAAKR